MCVQAATEPAPAKAQTVEQDSRKYSQYAASTSQDSQPTPQSDFSKR